MTKRRHGRYSIEDIAEVLGMTPGSTRHLLSRHQVKIKDFQAVIWLIHNQLKKRQSVELKDPTQDHQTDELVPTNN